MNMRIYICMAAMMFHDILRIGSVFWHISAEPSPWLSRPVHSPNGSTRV